MIKFVPYHKCGNTDAEASTISEASTRFIYWILIGTTEIWCPVIGGHNFYTKIAVSFVSSANWWWMEVDLVIFNVAVCLSISIWFLAQFPLKFV